ncbi:MAG: bifunctional diaminohydroxyphosphoribosylaminopyrimidine deaminase/5-amino-6-(5-phosphoribosylamino)uracil reductase RibD [Candidatus Limimorpha sp.]
MSDTDAVTYMRRAIEIARKGAGFVNPNPMVGCVVVKDNTVISEAYHECYGGYHAERLALMRCQTDTYGASLFVTLEPCCHYGKTPPCTDIIIEKGIKEVFVGITDPNPLVAGKGIKILENAGIKVHTGICQDEILEFNKVFIKYITTKRPYTILKTAMTLDGKIASYTGDSKWVTNEESRQIVHKLRNDLSGIVAGVGTVLADDPSLSCRLTGDQADKTPHQPVRIIVDSNLSTHLNSNIANTAKEHRTIIATTDSFVSSEQVSEKAENLKKKGIEILQCATKDGMVDIRDMVSRLGELGIDSLLLEGGGTLNASFLEAGCVDEVYCFIAPKIIGGKTALSPVSGHGIEKMSNAIALSDISVKRIGDDTLIIGKINNNIDNSCLQEL